jgi:hypothetical protein
MEFVWKLVLIWFGGAVVVCATGIVMALVGAALQSGLKPKSGWPGWLPEPTASDVPLAALAMFTKSFPIVVVVWPVLVPFVLYMGCLGLIKLPGWIWRRFRR